METLEEFREKIFKAMSHKPSFYRNGQFVFNHIEFEYGVADAVRIEDGIDCFYDDSKIDEFIECSYKRLNNKGYGS